jgi:uncharacterized protein (TIGR02145 family)
MAPTSVTASSAIVGVKITAALENYVTASGVCWSTSSAPTLESSYIENEYATGNFSIDLTDLEHSRTYYYRGYAKTFAGTTYGEEFILVTSYGTVSDIEGNVYQTVKIGNQIWMRENLRTSRYADGTKITGMSDFTIDNDYGHHYSFDAAVRKGTKNSLVIMEIQGVCPTGWHVPTDGEWAMLSEYLGVPFAQLNEFGLIGSDQGNALKEAGDSHWSVATGNNSTGFSALPAGICNGCELTCMNTETRFWTSSDNINYGFSCIYEQISRNSGTEGMNRFSVRCIKNLIK